MLLPELMTPLNLQRLKRLEAGELVWRGQQALANAAGRVATSLSAPRWERRRLARVLTPTPELAQVRSEIDAGRWMAAHAALANHFRDRSDRFLIGPAMRAGLSATIRERFADSAVEAAARADRILEGRYDILGYRDVPFDGRSWHSDPVHDRTPPATFWSTVPFMDPSCGDHKITWELNRHQHWMALGRAYWLTGDQRYREAVLTQLASWMDANPPLMGINWASMLELGFRSLSWLWTLNFFADPKLQDRSPWLVDLLLALDRQLSHIERHLSYYFSPNTHLLGEALALYVAGRTLPELAGSARREMLGRRILLLEIGRQVAADGGHCERSAHYHRYALDFYLLALAIARATNDEVAPLFQKICGRMAYAARVLADDRGRLPHLGDDDGGSLLRLTPRPVDDIRDSLAIAAALTGRTDLRIGALPEELWWVLGHDRFAESVARIEQAGPAVALESTALPATGYYVSRRGGDHLVVDAGAHGYMNGGHAHADALSLTLTRRGSPLLIDTGTACYTIDPALRDRFRSTDLHNTLTLDGRPQSIARGPFHWSHTAHGSARRWRTNRRFDYFAGTHDGYQPLTHARHVLAMHDDLLVVADCVTGRQDTLSAAVLRARHDAAVHWHVDPGWRLRARERSVRFELADQSVELVIAAGTLEVVYGGSDGRLGWYSPEYGRVEPMSSIRIAVSGRLPLWIVSVFGLNSANGIQRVALEAVEAPAHVLGHGIAVRITRDASIDQVLFAEPLGEPRHTMWRVGELQTDARMLFVRRTGGVTTDVAMADGTTVRAIADPRLQLAYPSPVADLYHAFSANPAPWSLGPGAWSLSGVSDIEGAMGA